MFYAFMTDKPEDSVKRHKTRHDPMVCGFCGEEVQQGALACPRCGSPVERTAPAVEPEEQPPEVAVTDISALADQTVLPGTETEVTPEHVVLEDKLTGGFKGPEPASVSGAGVQTAEDPFGLRITEKAPPVPVSPRTKNRGSRRKPSRWPWRSSSSRH